MRADFANTYAGLPERFFVRTAPTPVAAPSLIEFNDPLARELGVRHAPFDNPRLAACCVGNEIPPGAAPLAMAYAGHQFGSFVPQLGDGRALLIGEVVDTTGRRRDLQWKGAGPTPFSRRGDGRAALGPVLREYVVSEAMHALGVPTTRALAATLTGESVLREDGPQPGAVLIRVAASHIRVGTFEFFAARDDVAGVRILADYVIERHYPELRESADSYFGLFEAIVERQCALIARWMQLGFIHGVMNTDNMTVSGETIDFGPCAFMDEYDPATVFSFIDRRGRYSYQNQPAILQWNLARLAEALLPLFDAAPDRAIERATCAIHAIPARYAALWLQGVSGKLGLRSAETADAELIQSLLAIMQAERSDFTNTFRALASAANDQSSLPAAFHSWGRSWRKRLEREVDGAAGGAAHMRAVNPAFVPRNHRVEEIIQAAVSRGDFTPFRALQEVLARPYDDQPGHSAYRAPPQPEERVRNTFCGT